MADVIIISSGSDGDSDVEIIGGCAKVEAAGGERLNFAATAAPMLIDLVESAWACKGLTRCRRRNCRKMHDSKTLPSDESGPLTETPDQTETSAEYGTDSAESPARYSCAVSEKRDNDIPISERGFFCDFKTEAPHLNEDVKDNYSGISRRDLDNAFNSPFSVYSEMKSPDWKPSESSRCKPPSPSLPSPSLCLTSPQTLDLNAAYHQVESQSSCHGVQNQGDLVAKGAAYTWNGSIDYSPISMSSAGDSPAPFDWHDRAEEEVCGESTFEQNLKSVSREDRRFICPSTFQRLVSGAVRGMVQDLPADGVQEEDGGFAAEELCRRSLSLVYITMEENYPEGTLQLLSDLLQPGFYSPRDVTDHVLRRILLEPQTSQHLCVQAFNLLMRTQRHHRADKTTISWDWELLTSVMENQEHSKRLRWEVVRMLLEYVVQTMEDDFQAKLSPSALHHSITKATFSCNSPVQFGNVRSVIKWLFAAVMKSTERGEGREALHESDEHVRMVQVFQRMLTLALEVDRSPALSSDKLSQELFHTLLCHMPLRAHRMLLLETIECDLLRRKLLQHLLDHACPEKTRLPMSLGRLLHFLKNCAPKRDLTDGSERSLKWEELLQLLWMLLISYNKVMKGRLYSSVTERTGGVHPAIRTPHDAVSQSAVLEAVESFRSRSFKDLSHALPCHVEESLTYLQEHLFDVCQC